MMKERLRFLLVVLLAAMLLFSCASNDDESADELPAVEAVSDASDTGAAENAGPAADAASALTAPQAVSETEVSNADAGTVPDMTVSEQDDLYADGSAPDEESGFDEAGLETSASAEDLYPSGGLTAEYIENEFVPFEEEKEYTLDVAGYYDGFSISEDDFVAVVMPEPEPVVSVETPVMAEASVTETILPEEAVPAATAVTEEAIPVMEPLSVPAPREEMKKPVAVITEEEAGAAEHELEVAVDELTDLLASIPEPEEPSKPVPSRSVAISRNDIIEVPYQGNWWVYLGDANGSGALTFLGRDYKSDKTVFTLRAIHEGEALLHFYKQDIIADVLVDDYLEVTVGESTGASEKMVLDMFVISQIKPVPPEADESAEGEGAEEALQTVKTEPENIPETKETAVSPVYESVKQTATVPVIAEEADVVSGMEEEEAPIAASMNDEELFRKAQELEASDIEGALELYQLLVARYPASQYWTQANRRITYINRFYFFKR